MNDPKREPAFLSTIGFTGGLIACRAITHAIRHHIPPFHNLSSKAGTHIHHSTFGILGLLGIGFLWTQQVVDRSRRPAALGLPDHRRHLRDRRRDHPGRVRAVARPPRR